MVQERVLFLFLNASFSFDLGGILYINNWFCFFQVTTLISDIILLDKTQNNVK